MKCCIIYARKHIFLVRVNQEGGLAGGCRTHGEEYYIILYYIIINIYIYKLLVGRLVRKNHFEEGNE
jgi:hypothetical protein